MTSVDRDMDKVAAKPERKAILIEGEFRLDFQERKTPGGRAWERPPRMMEALTAPGHGCAVALTPCGHLSASRPERRSAGCWGWGPALAGAWLLPVVDGLESASALILFAGIHHGANIASRPPPEFVLGLLRP
jgi:hypothetical protein